MRKSRVLEGKAGKLPSQGRGLMGLLSTGQDFCDSLFCLFVYGGHFYYFKSKWGWEVLRKRSTWDHEGWESGRLRGRVGETEEGGGAGPHLSLCSVLCLLPWPGQLVHHPLKTPVFMSKVPTQLEGCSQDRGTGKPQSRARQSSEQTHQGCHPRDPHGQRVALLQGPSSGLHGVSRESVGQVADPPREARFDLGSLLGPLPSRTRG